MTSILGVKNADFWPMRIERSQGSETNPRSTAITTLATPAEFAAASQSKATRRAYASALKSFSGWCRHQGHRSFPVTPEMLATYLSALASSGKSLSTIRKAKAAIDGIHGARDLPTPGDDPRVRMVLRGITRELGVAPRTQKAPLLVEHLREIVARLPNDVKGTRDRAMLLLGFSMAARRSELVRLRVDDLIFGHEGLTLVIRRSKTDQDGRGATVGVPYGRCRTTCPVRAVEEWLAAACITEGPVFRQVSRHGHVGIRQLGGEAVALLTQRAVEEVGLDPSLYGGHSLRAGLITAAAHAGVEERVIAQQSRHKSTTVLRGYIRASSVFRENAAGSVGL